MHDENYIRGSQIGWMSFEIEDGNHAGSGCRSLGPGIKEAQI